MSLQTRLSALITAIGADIKALKAPQVVTGLPAVTAADHGKLVYLRVDEAGTYGGPLVWLCRYAHYKADGTTLNPQTHKWDVLSGEPLMVEQRAEVNKVVGNGTWESFPSAPSILVPRSGVYRCENKASVCIGGGGSVGLQLGLLLNGTTDMAQGCQGSSINGGWCPMNDNTIQQLFTGIGVDTVQRILATSGGITLYRRNATLALTPRRIS